MLFYGLVCTFFSLAVIFFLNHVWKKRHIYYCAWKLPGPFTLPFVGSVFFVASIQVHKDAYSALLELCRRQKSIFKIGLLDDLYVVNSKPEDVEILLKTCLGKPRFYSTWDELVNDESTLVTAPVETWKEQRKDFNRSFNLQILDSFHGIFLKYSKDAVKVLDHKSEQVQTNFLYDIWRCNLDIFLEALVDINPQLFDKSSEFMKLVVRAEEIIIERFKNVRLMVDPLYQISSYRKEAKSIAMETVQIGKKMLTLRKIPFSDFQNVDMFNDNLKMKRFMNQLLIALDNKSTAEKNIIAESVIMSIASSETSAIAITYVVLTLGILPDIQKKVYEEICSVCPATDDFSLEDMNKMEYLERVIKETLRFFPVIPIIMRTIDEDTKLESYVQPAGSHVVIMISHIHKNPEFWPNPLKFDPDRFLPEEAEKRHRCTYLPFSFGPRNCIGYKYAMMSMKVMVAQLVKHFVFKTLDCNSLEDIETEFKIMNHPINYKILCEKRL